MTKGTTKTTLTTTAMAMTTTLLMTTAALAACGASLNTQPADSNSLVFMFSSTHALVLTCAPIHHVMYET